MFSRSVVFWVVLLGWAHGMFYVSRAVTPPVIDEFTDPHSLGQVPGSSATSGAARLVLDKAGTLTIEDGVLRMPPPLTNAWGVQGISYGPFAVVPGLSMAARIRFTDWTSVDIELGCLLDNRF